MTKEPPIITIDPESELARVLAASDEPLILDSNGVRYTVNRQHDELLAGYNPERTREALRKSAGAFRGLDLEALKRELREQRSQDSQGRPT